jgi:hypothetical protein
MLFHEKFRSGNDEKMPRSERSSRRSACPGRRENPGAIRRHAEADFGPVLLQSFHHAGNECFWRQIGLEVAAPGAAFRIEVGVHRRGTISKTLMPCFAGCNRNAMEKACVQALLAL